MGYVVGVLALGLALGVRYGFQPDDDDELQAESACVGGFGVAMLGYTAWLDAAGLILG